MRDINIRPYSSSDFPSITRIWENAAKPAYYFMDDEFFVNERKHLSNIEFPNVKAWVITFEDEVAGFIALTKNRIGVLFIDPKYQGYGFGTRLIEKAKSIHNILLVEVFEENEFGMLFYQRNGFHIIDKKRWKISPHNVLMLAYSDK